MSKRTDLITLISNYLVANGVRAITAAKVNEINTFIANNYATKEELSTSLLSDVDKTYIDVDDVMKWNGAKFVKWTPTFGTLNDVDMSSVGLGDTIVWMGTHWFAIALITTLNGLEGVDISNCENRDILTYNSSANAFVNTPKRVTSTDSSPSLSIRDDTNIDVYNLTSNGAITITLFKMKAGVSIYIITPPTTAFAKAVTISGYSCTINGVGSYAVVTPNTVIELCQVTVDDWVVMSVYQN